jgi:hypothetical protein
MFASAHRDPKKSFPRVDEFWPIPALDRKNPARFGNAKENNEIKAKLIQAWGLMPTLSHA